MGSITKKQWRVVLLSSIGGCLEFYDFVIFGIFAVAIGHTFFPAKNSFVSVIAAFSVFAVGYFARIAGGIIFSHLGDRYGRKNVFTSTMIIMALPTLCMGILPGYLQMGISAPILFVILRIIQGGALGGEIPGAITFISEHVSLHRGLGCGILMLFIQVGPLLGDSVNALLRGIVANQYSWRIAFILGSLLAIVSYFIRKKLQESPEFVQCKTTVKLPLISLFKHHIRNTVSGISLLMMHAIIISLFYLFIASYMQMSHHFNALQISQLTIINLVILAISCGIWGWISDRLPEKLLIYISVIMIPLLGIWFYHAMNQQQHIMLPYALLSIFCGMYIGSIFSWVTKLFPVKVRFSGVAICYNVSFALVGGLSPVLATYLIDHYHNTMIPAYLVLIIAPISLLGCMIGKRAND